MNVEKIVGFTTRNQLYAIFGRSSESLILMERLFFFMRFSVYVALS